MKKLALVLLLIVPLNSGCVSWFKAKTAFRTGIFGTAMEDTKDNDITMKGLKYNSKTGDFSVDEFIVINSASTTYKAQEELAKLKLQESMEVNKTFQALVNKIPQFPVVGP